MPAPDYGFDPLPTPPTEADRRAAVLRRDPRALALMMSGMPPMREAGTHFDTSQLARAQAAQGNLGQQFAQAMQRGEEQRTRAFGSAELGLKGQGAEVERGRLALAREQLEMGRWVPIQGQDGITYLYDQKTHAIVNGVVPGAGWSQGGGVPGATVAPGTGMPGRGGPPAPAGGPQAPPQAPPGVPPQARAFMEMAGRKNMPPHALTELDQGDKTLQAIDQGLAAVRARPQAFSAGQGWEENLPTDFARGLGRSAHQRYRDPGDTAARASVYGYVVGQMHDYFGARMTEPEFSRAGLFLPGVQESPQNIEAKLLQARRAILARNARLKGTYMPALNYLPGGGGPAAGAPPAPGAAGAPPAAGASPAPGAGKVRIPVTRGGQTRYWNGQSWED